MALVMALALLQAAPGLAGDDSSGNAGTYGAPFLRIPVGARLMSSPDVLLGMSPDASAAFSNPAFLTDLHSGQLFLSTASWLEELSFSAASGVFQLSGDVVVGLGATFLYSGGIQGYDASLNVVDEVNYHDNAFSASVARRFGDFSLGGTASYIRQYVHPAHANGYAFSFGGSYRRGPNFAHASALDVGGQVQFDAVSYPIDGDVLLGAGRVFRTGIGRIVAGAQMRFSGAAEDRLELGADYQMGRHVTVRAAVPDVTGSGTTLSGGLGVAYGLMHLDYAYTPVEYFSATHTISLVFGFGGGDSPGPTPTADEGMPAAAGDRAPVISPSQIQAPNSYILVAGSYSTLAEARSAATALETSGVLTEVDPLAGGTYRVIVGRYTSRASAERALAMYSSRNHKFLLVSE
jgi:hypothetical protein